MKKQVENHTGKDLAIVIMVMGLGVLAIAMLQPVLPLYLTSIGTRPEILGLMFSVAMVGMMLGESSWGWAADKVGVRVPLIVGTIVSASVVICFAFTRNTIIIFLIFFFWGAFRSALFGPGRGFIGTAAPLAKKATFMAIISVLLSASRSLGALPSGFLADHWGYHSVIYVSCGTALLAGLFLLKGPKKRIDPEEIPASPTGKIKLKLLIAVYQPLAPQCLVAFFNYLGLGAFITFLPLLATQVIGVSATKVGILFTLGGLVAVILGIPMGIVADRIGKKITMTLGLVLSAMALIAMPWARDYVWLLGLVVLRSVGMVTFSPAALGLLSESIPSNRQSTVMGIYGGVCENSGVIVGSALGGLIWTSVGPWATFILGGMASALGALVCLLFISPQKDPRNGEANT
jgi:MFS family permease